MFSFSLPSVETLFDMIVSWLFEQWPCLLAVALLCAGLFVLLSAIWKEDAQDQSAS